jgi:hypothetical protein
MSESDDFQCSRIDEMLIEEFYPIRKYFPEED